MRVALFIPCYVDQLYPDVGMATVEVLEKLSVEVEFPEGQTCCGQPMANTGCAADTAPLARRFLEVFRDASYVVSPSGSCVSMVRNHYDQFLQGQPGFEELKGKVYELCEFLTDVLQVQHWEGRFPYRVGLHQSCHGLRELRMGPCSERMEPGCSKPRKLLEMLEGIEFSDLQRPDECCGFGGTFAVNEEAISCMMGLDRLADHEQAGTQVLTAPDVSCLMHMQGLLQRRKDKMHVMHIAQILAGRKRRLMAASLHDHPAQAELFVHNQQRAHWHDQALWFVRAKRDRAAATLPEWELLRENAAAIKRHTLANLADYLEQFAREAEQQGARVHWASDAEEHNQIVLRILQQHGLTRVAKSKSMLTEECHLNPFLEREGIEVIDTDLGERIVQLRQEPPSHIVLPAIHIKKEEVGQVFHQHLGTVEGSADPDYLTEAARGHLREKFLAAEAGITGVNFAIAETGGIVVCTNEGNADLGVALPRVHIACMGVEKLIPGLSDLAVMTRLLARSATGQPITTYTSHFHGPLPGGELHIVIVDNGRSQLLGNTQHRSALSCIRCGACMNTCPVYRRSGGHSYQATIPGPIGSILGPMRDVGQYASLPFACSLCGSCTDVCPVKIDLHHQLYLLRQDVARGGFLAWQKRWSMKLARWIMGGPRRFNLLGKMARRTVPWMPRFLVYNRLNAWGRQRELPPMPRRSFRELYRERPKG